MKTFLLKFNYYLFCHNFCYCIGIRKLRQNGAEKRVSTIKRRQKELISRLRQERAQLQCMQEAYRSSCEKHHSLLKDKKKLLKDPSLLAFELLSSKLLKYIYCL